MTDPFTHTTITDNLDTETLAGYLQQARTEAINALTAVLTFHYEISGLPPALTANATKIVDAAIHAGGSPITVLCCEDPTDVLRLATAVLAAFLGSTTDRPTSNDLQAAATTIRALAV